MKYGKVKGQKMANRKKGALAGSKTGHQKHQKMGPFNRMAAGK